MCLQRKVSSFDRAKGHILSADWSSGATWVDDKPQEDVDEENICLMHNGSCAAFIHGLEDEFSGNNLLPVVLFWFSFIFSLLALFLFHGICMYVRVKLINFVFMLINYHSES